jgi:hypothetical protein
MEIEPKNVDPGYGDYEEGEGYYEEEGDVMERALKVNIKQGKNL